MLSSGGVTIADIVAIIRAEGVEEVERKLNGLGKKLNDTKAVMEKVGTAATVFGAALTATAGVAVKRAGDFERLQTRLVSIFGSVEKGSEAFRQLNELAAKTPFSLEGVIEAGSMLAAYLGRDRDQAVELTKDLADLAAYMGDDIAEAARAFGMAMAAGASGAEMLRRRGVLAAVADFARLKYGINDLTKLTLPEFRRVMIEAIRDPSLGIAGSTERLSKTFTGAWSNMTDALDRFAASMGQTLLPTVTGALRLMTRFLDALAAMPSGFKAVGAVVTVVVGGLSMLAGTVALLIPKVLGLATSLSSLGVTLGGLAAATGPIAAVALALGGIVAVHLSLVDAANRADAASIKFSQTQERLATTVARTKQEIDALRLAKLDLVVQSAAESGPSWLEQKLFGVKEAKPGAYALRRLREERQRLRRELAKASKEGAGEAGGEETTTFDQFLGARVRKFTEAQQRTIATMEAWGQKWQAAQDALLRQQEQMAERAEIPIIGPMLSPEQLQALEEKLAAQKAAIESTKQALAALEETALRVAQNIGEAFGQMAREGEKDIGQIIAALTKMIIKLLIVKALQLALPGFGGQFLGSVAMGFLGALGFDDPAADAKAWKFGIDFGRNFRAGMMQALNPAGASLAFAGATPVPVQVQVFEPGPMTSVRVVRSGLRRMSEFDRLDVQRLGLGRAGDRWNER